MCYILSQHERSLSADDIPYEDVAVTASGVGKLNLYKAAAHVLNQADRDHTFGIIHPRLILKYSRVHIMKLIVQEGHGLAIRPSQA